MFPSLNLSLLHSVYMTARKGQKQEPCSHHLLWLPFPWCLPWWISGRARTKGTSGNDILSFYSDLYPLRMGLCAIANVAAYPCCTLSRNYDSVWEADRILSLPLPRWIVKQKHKVKKKKKKEASRSGFVYAAFKIIILVLRNFWLNKLQTTAL